MAHGGWGVSTRFQISADPNTFVRTNVYTNIFVRTTVYTTYNY
jgi:hypothetical protein